jgi:hypothetical protein
METSLQGGKASLQDGEALLQGKNGVKRREYG